MRPVDQTNFGPGPGSCTSACIASLLERDLSRTPSFSGPDWWDEWQEWLSHLGLHLEATWTDGRVHLGQLPCEGYAIAVGLSPRGGVNEAGRPIYHAVIFEGRRMVHDPHPSRDGIEDIAEFWQLVEGPPA